jgi:uncharacterized membrane protein YfcA
MTELFADPLFYVVAVPAVILVGLSKGGLGGSMGFIGVPLMAMAVPPVQAAAILLPILLLMDLVSLWSWRGIYDMSILKTMIPGAMVGIVIGWLTAAMVTESAIRFIVGAMAVAFVGRWLYQQFRSGAVEHASPKPVAASFWSTIAGFTSFVAHAGGPPYQVYTLPLGLDPKVFTGTSVIFFAVTNAVKLVPYFALGQFDAANLTASAALMPLAPLSTIAGAFVVKRMRPEVFYPFTYATIAVFAAIMVYEGVVGLLAT